MIAKHINGRAFRKDGEICYSEDVTSIEQVDTLYYFLIKEYSKLENGAALPNVEYTKNVPLIDQITNPTTFDQLCVCEIFK